MIKKDNLVPFRALRCISSVGHRSGGQSGGVVVLPLTLPGLLSAYAMSILRSVR